MGGGRPRGMRCRCVLMLVEAITALPSVPAISPPSGMQTKTFFLPGLIEPVHVFEAVSLVDQSNTFIRGRNEDPFGQICWPASRILCSALAELAHQREKGLVDTKVVE